MTGFKKPLFALCLLSVACPAFSVSCPPAEEVLPCVCFDDYDELRLQCYQVDIDLDDLKRLLRVFQKTGSKFDVELFWAKLGPIPFDFFRGFDINLLEFSNCEIDFPIGEGRPFTGLEYVLKDVLIISCFHGENVLTQIDWTHLRHLTNLDISHNAIAGIDDSWQDNVPPQITYLLLMENGLTSLGTRAFDQFQNLERFGLYSNRVGELQRTLLPNPVPHLRELELVDNALTSLPEDFFSGMPSLRSLSLRNNRFTTIPERTFLPVWQQLEEFDITENPLNCDDASIDWMCRVRSTAEIEGTCAAPPDREGMELSDLIQRRRNELQGNDNSGMVMEASPNCDCAESGISNL